MCSSSGLSGTMDVSSRSDVNDYITVMKGAKRDTEREIEMQVYIGTYKDISYKTTERSTEQKRNDTAQYGRKLRHKLDRRAEQRQVESQNGKSKMECKRKVGVKRTKEAFERLW